MSPAAWVPSSEYPPPPPRQHRETRVCAQCGKRGDWPGDFCCDDHQRTWMTANVAGPQRYQPADSARTWGARRRVA